MCSVVKTKAVRWAVTVFDPLDFSLIIGGVQEGSRCTEEADEDYQHVWIGKASRDCKDGVLSSAVRRRFEL